MMVESLAVQSAAEAALNVSSVQWYINGQTGSEAFLRALSGWVLEHTLSKPAKCTLHLVELPANESLKAGDLIEIKERHRAIFTGEVAKTLKQLKANGLRVQSVEALNDLAKLERNQKMVAHAASDLDEASKEIFAKASLTQKSYCPSGPSLMRHLQWGKSDLTWIADLCATYGRYFSLNDEEVHLFNLQDGIGQPVELQAGVNLFEYVVIEDQANSRKKAAAFLTAADDGSPVDVADSGGPAKGADRQLGGGFGASARETLAEVAKADLARGQAAAHYVEGLCEGNGMLVPGACITLKDHDADLEERFTVTCIRHEMSPGSGFTTFFSSRPPAPPVSEALQNIGLGRVSDSGDPKNAGRVRVSLDAFNGLETDWLNVCFAGAGKAKGFVVAPEVGDQVVVAFPNDNVAQGVVIGAIYGKTELPDNDVKERRPRPYSLTTADGQSLRLDDHIHAASLRSKGGDLVLDPRKVVLHANADLDISAPGRRITITASRIDFKKG